MKAKILVIDDNSINLELMEFLLQAHGYKVQTACGATTALHVLQSEVPDLILMDLQLPGLDGYALTSQLKASQRTAHIPVVAVTSYAMSGDRQKALSAGCDEHVAKPVDTRTFPRLVERVLATNRMRARASGD